MKGIGPELLEREPGISWVDVAGMRNHLAHGYFDTAYAIVQATLDHDLPPLVDAARRLRADLIEHPQPDASGAIGYGELVDSAL